MTDPAAAATPAPFMPAEANSGPHAPLTAQDFAALITYRGPAVEARRVPFEQVNEALTDLYARALALLEQGREGRQALSDLWTHDLAAWFWRLESTFLRELWVCSVQRAATRMLYGQRLDRVDLCADLLYVRTLLNMAILHDALSPTPLPRPEPTMEQDDPTQDDDPV